VPDSRSTDIGRLIELARAQAGAPGEWSLATHPQWLERMYVGAGVVTRVWTLPAGSLAGSAAIHTAASDPPGGPDVATVTSMLRAGHEELWDTQREWVETVLDQAANATPDAMVQVVSESLHDAEVARWSSLGFRLAFEELAMELDLTLDVGSPPPPWPGGARVLEWGPDALAASFAVYEAAFRDRPGFPGWSQSEWADRLAGGDDFLAEASLCVFVDDAPSGFVVCSTGWIDQVGVIPARRRAGLASRLVTEAARRMRAGGGTVARLHVNTNNAAALAAWRAMGWRIVGRRGRFERRVVPL
jgi:mycothiol synthase